MATDQQIIKAIKGGDHRFIDKLKEIDKKRLHGIVDSSSGISLPQLALQLRNIDVFMSLLNANSDCLNVIDGERNTLAHLIVRAGWHPGLIVLFKNEKSKALLNKANKKGQYLLHVAADFAWQEPERNTGVSAILNPFSSNKAVKSEATSGERMLILEYLLGIPEIIHLTREDFAKNTPLKLAQKRKNEKAVVLISAHISAIKTCQDKIDLGLMPPRNQKEKSVKHTQSKEVVKVKGDSSWVGALIGMLFLYPWLTMLMAVLFVFLKASLVVSMAHLGGLSGLFFGAIIGIGIWKLAGVEDTKGWMIGAIIGGTLGLSLGLLICNVLAPGIGWVWGPLITGILDAAGMLIFGVAGKLISMWCSTEEEENASMPGIAYAPGEDYASQYINMHPAPTSALDYTRDGSKAVARLKENSAYVEWYSNRSSQRLTSTGSS